MIDQCRSHLLECSVEGVLAHDSLQQYLCVQRRRHVPHCVMGVGVNEDVGLR